MEITAEAALEEAFAKMGVRYVWKIDGATLRKIRSLKDSTGRYFWEADLTNDTSSGSFLGHPIEIVDEPSFELIIVVPKRATVVRAD